VKRVELRCVLTESALTLVDDLNWLFNQAPIQALPHPRRENRPTFEIDHPRGLRTHLYRPSFRFEQRRGSLLTCCALKAFDANHTTVSSTLVTPVNQLCPGHHHHHQQQQQQQPAAALHGLRVECAIESDRYNALHNDRNWSLLAATSGNRPFAQKTDLYRIILPSVRMHSVYHISLYR